VSIHQNPTLSNVKKEIKKHYNIKELI